MYLICGDRRFLEYALETQESSSVASSKSLSHASNRHAQPGVRQLQLNHANLISTELLVAMFADSFQCPRSISSDNCHSGNRLAAFCILQGKLYEVKGWVCGFVATTSFSLTRGSCRRRTSLDTDAAGR